MLDSRLRGNDVVVEKSLPEVFALNAAERSLRCRIESGSKR